MIKYFKSVRQWLARRIITEGDIKESKTYSSAISERDKYKKALEGYQDVIKRVADLTSKQLTLRKYNGSVDINSPEDAQRLLEEVGKLEKVLSDKNNLINLHRHAEREAKKYAQELEELRIPRELLFSAVEYIPKAILIFDNELTLVSYSPESKKYFGALRKQMQGSRLFSSSRGFSEFSQGLSQLEKDALLEMRVRIKERRKMGERRTREVNTITKPIYNEDNLVGYVSLIEVDSIIKGALEAIKNIFPERQEKDIPLDERGLELS